MVGGLAAGAALVDPLVARAAALSSRGCSCPALATLQVVPVEPALLAPLREHSLEGRHDVPNTPRSGH
jgi:hypothetical protein